eukprot:GSMAST32.ASY1.ANO1.1257.1 assembled CDS
MGQTGSRKTTKQILRENKRMIKRSQRDMTRERRSLEKQEKQLIQDIKKNAKANQISAVKIMARDLVRTRNFIEKFIKMESQLAGVSLKLETCRSTEAMTSAIRGVTRGMRMMNRQMNIPQMQRIMYVFYLNYFVFFSNVRFFFFFFHSKF